MEKVYIKEKEVNCNLELYLKPEYIYIPIDNIRKYKYMFKKGDYVYLDDSVLEYDNNSIYSPISGYIRGNTYKYTFDGKRKKCIVIENDYKDKYKKRSDINNYINIINNIKYLVINAIDIEPYVFSKRCFVLEYYSKILEIIDNIMERFNVEKTYISVTEDSSYNGLYKYIGTYPNIKIVKVDNYYGVANDRILLKELFNNNYQNKSISVLDVSSLLDVYSLIKKNRPKYEKIITIGGNKIKNTNIKVKIGTSFREIVNFLGGYTSCDNLLFTIGGPLGGKRIDNDDFVITEDITSVFVTKKNNIEEKECTLCGKCISVCPIDLMPVFIMKNINNKKYLNKLNTDKCIECGLCTYICPSYINLKEYINKAKEVIKSE